MLFHEWRKLLQIPTKSHESTFEVKALEIAFDSAHRPEITYRPAEKWFGKFHVTSPKGLCITLKMNYLVYCKIY